MTPNEILRFLLSRLIDEGTATVQSIDLFLRSAVRDGWGQAYITIQVELVLCGFRGDELNDTTRTLITN